MGRNQRPIWGTGAQCVGPSSFGPWCIAPGWPLPTGSSRRCGAIRALGAGRQPWTGGPRSPCGSAQWTPAAARRAWMGPWRTGQPCTGSSSCGSAARIGDDYPCSEPRVIVGDRGNDDPPAFEREQVLLEPSDSTGSVGAASEPADSASAPGCLWSFRNPSLPLPDLGHRRAPTGSPNSKGGPPEGRGSPRITSVGAPSVQHEVQALVGAVRVPRRSLLSHVYRSVHVSAVDPETNGGPCGRHEAAHDQGPPLALSEGYHEDDTQEHPDDPDYHAKQQEASGSERPVKHPQPRTTRTRRTLRRHAPSVTSAPRRRSTVQ